MAKPSSDLPGQTITCLICGGEATVFHVFPRRALLNKPLPEPEPEAVADFPLGYCAGCRHVSGSYDSPLAAEARERVYRELYSRHAPTSLSDGQVRWQELVAAWLLDRAPAGGRVLEIGCHDGHLLSLLAAAGLAVEGVEPSPFAVAARRRGLAVRQEFFHADVFAAGSFDLVVLRHVLEHVPEPAAMVADAARLLRPGGLLYVEVPNSLVSLEQRIYPEFHVDHLSYFTPASLRFLVERSGAGRIVRLESAWAYINFPFLCCLAAIDRPTAPADGTELHDFAIGRTLSGFGDRFPAYLANVRSLPARGRLGVWGAGVMGTQFAIDGGWSEQAAWVVDPNPVNEGLRLSVTGHRVHAPATLDEVGVEHVLLASGWEEDARRQLAEATRRAVPVHVFADLLGDTDTLG